jgi:polysaccharide biosynthesis/export protein
MNNCIRRVVLTIGIVAIPVLLCVASIAQSGLNVKVVHSGYSATTNTNYLLLGKGATDGITANARYQVSMDGHLIGELAIESVLPESAVGVFRPGDGAAMPPIGSFVSILPVAGEVNPVPDKSFDTPTKPPDKTAESAASSYKVGAGDVLKINTWPKDILPDTITVRDDGSIALPYVGRIFVEGRNVFEIADRILSGIKPDFKRPWVEVIVAEYHSSVVRAMGELASARPGEYPLKDRTRLLDFLSTLGGLTDRADTQNIKVIHHDGSENIVDLSKIYDQPTSADNITLQAGDLVFIPALDASKNRILVLGSVMHQGVVLLDKEHMMLLDALSEAGGLTDVAEMENVFIARQVNGEKQVHHVDLSKMQKGAFDADFQVQPGDLVYVPAVIKGEKKKAIERFNEMLKDILPTINLIYLLNHI